MSNILRRYWPALAAIFALLYLSIMLLTGALPQRNQLIRYEAKGLLTIDPERITRVSIQRAEKSVQLLREQQHWVRQNQSPTQLDTTLMQTLNRAVKFMHTSNPVRVLSGTEVQTDNLASFGLAPARLSVILADTEGMVLQAAFGGSNSDGFLQYLRLQGHDELYLMSRFVGKEWETVANALLP